MEITFKLVQGLQAQIKKDKEQFNKTGKETKLLSKVRDLIKSVDFETQIKIIEKAY